MTYTKKDWDYIMKLNGYRLIPDRGKGSHMVYVKGTNKLSISRKYNKMIIRRLIKENNLVVNI